MKNEKNSIVSSTGTFKYYDDHSCTYCGRKEF